MNAAPLRASRLLEQVLLWNVLIHVAALLSMGAILQSALPGAPRASHQRRMSLLAAHPWLWRLGWLAWHLAALIDLLTAIALVRTTWVPKLPAVLTLLVTLAAVAADQTGEFVWVTRCVELAQAGDLTAFLEME